MKLIDEEGTIYDLKDNNYILVDKQSEKKFMDDYNNNNTPFLDEGIIRWIKENYGNKGKSLYIETNGTTMIPFILCNLFTHTLVKCYNHCYTYNTSVVVSGLSNKLNYTMSDGKEDIKSNCILMILTENVNDILEYHKDNIKDRDINDKPKILINLSYSKYKEEQQRINELKEKSHNIDNQDSQDNDNPRAEEHTSVLLSPAYSA